MVKDKGTYRFVRLVFFLLSFTLTHLRSLLSVAAVVAGLNCQFVIVTKPAGASVSDRAVPVAIFSAEDGVRKAFLRKSVFHSSTTILALPFMHAVGDWQVDGRQCDNGFRHSQLARLGLLQGTVYQQPH